MAGFDPIHTLPRRSRTSHCKHTKMKLKNLAAEARKRAHDEKLAAVWKSAQKAGRWHRWRRDVRF